MSGGEGVEPQSQDECVSQEPVSNGENSLYPDELQPCYQATGLTWPDLPLKYIAKVKSLFALYSDARLHLTILDKENGKLKTELVEKTEQYESSEENLRKHKSDAEKKVLDLERRVSDYDNALKASKEKLASVEAHNMRYMEETAAKMNSTISQLTKRMEATEKEKNDTVVRYAMREAEILRLRDEREKYEKEKKALLSEMVALKKSAEVEQLERLEKSLDEKHNELNAERRLQREKDAEHQMALKRIEASHTAINELRTSLEQLQKQLARESEEKAVLSEDHKKLTQEVKLIHQRKNEEVEAAHKETVENEDRYNGVLEELALLKKQKADLQQEIEKLEQRNQEMIEECSQMDEELAEMKSSHADASEKLRLLENIHAQVNSSLRRAEEAERSAEEAKANMEQAEVEAAGCRAQAERLLELTEQLTEKNSALSSECESLNEECRNTKASLVDVTAEAESLKSQLDELKQKSDLLESSSSVEISSLELALKSKTDEVDGLLQKLEEANNEKEVIKRKNASFIKELRSELHSLRKKEITIVSDATVSDTQESDSVCLSANGNIGESTSSRASSISSADLNSRALASSPPPIEPITSTGNVQQQMVEKIVKLQKALARKQEKIEFLEEHIQQCTLELCKKTKIIQNYALREEASLLLPADDGLTKVPLNRRASGMSLMGSMFSTGDRKTELDLATEVNSRLQAVLEDALHKNITLKTNLDTLGEEIARLSRENRQLTLQKLRETS